ncbi:MAG: transposase [Oscillospiraceae bacterium]
MYFITICVKEKHEMLWEYCVGAIINRPNSQIELSEYGFIVDSAINNISKNYSDVIVDKYVIMPNHIHMILILENTAIEDGRLIIAPTISTVIKQLKRYVSKQISFSLWQKSFHNHIIRNEQEYQQIGQYIETNSLKWEFDKYNIISR